MLVIRMDYTSFDDFWHPMVYGQGTFGSFFDALPETRRDRLRRAVRAAYLAGDDDGPRGFASIACGPRHCLAPLRQSAQVRSRRADAPNDVAMIVPRLCEPLAASQSTVSWSLGVKSSPADDVVYTAEGPHKAEPNRCSAANGECVPNGDM